MEQSSDFKPLESVTLPEIGDLRCSGLIVVVGPNSSGKSQLLQDIYQRLSGEPRALVVATNIEIAIKKQEYEQFTEQLKLNGYIESIFDDNGTESLRPRTIYLGTGQAINTIQPQQAQNLLNTHLPDIAPTEKRRNEFLNYFGRMFVTALFLDRRLVSLNQVGVIDYLNQQPQHDLHALYLDDTARARLNTEMFESFGKAVWPDSSRGTVLRLCISDEGILPTAEERHSHKKMAIYRSIESEGDGLKSYLAICTALLLGRRPVCLIDEPEMCLHPPQALSLGRFIGNYGSSRNTVTLVATHSSQILRGIIQIAKDIQIVRLTRHEKNFSAHLVSAEILAEAVAKPTVRAESVLDGIFAQSVIVLEADGDRLVYQTAWESLSSELQLDVHFTTVGGTGGIADTCNLYRKLKIPVAVIADMDVIADPIRMRKILEVMTTADVVNDLIERTRLVMEAIRQLPPTISPEEVRQHLTSIIPNSDEWKDETDINVRRELNRIAGKLDRMRQFKRGGLKVLPTTISQPLEQLLSTLKGCGVFIVPVGELEEWLADSEIQVSKENKWAWANAAAQYIQQEGASKGDIWEFIRDVGKFLSQKIS